MTGRDRLEAIIHRLPADGLSWTTLVDDITLQGLPEHHRGNGGLDFYRHLGCDIFLINGWGTSFHFDEIGMCQWPEGVEEARWQEDGRSILEIRTEEGSLRTEFRGNHPVKPLVTTAKELSLYRRLWEGTHYRNHNNAAGYGEILKAVGEDGVAVRAWGPSTIPRLLEYDMGIEAFYYLLHDESSEMDALIRQMHKRECEAFEYLAQGPYDTVLLTENTSTFYISPDIYRRYNGPHVRDFVDIMHSTGKNAIIHMCGHVRGLLDQIRQTGLDGVHALTPPPTGDTPWELALDELGDDSVIFGILDPSIFISGPVGDIEPALDTLYTPRLRRSNFVLWPAADGIAVPQERFEAVARWMDRNRRG
jgi:hypothetical protein